MGKIIYLSTSRTAEYTVKYESAGSIFMSWIPENYFEIADF